MKSNLLLMAAALVACKSESKADLGDIPEDSGTVVEDCDTTIENVTPTSGQGDWFYRQPLVLTFSDSNPGLTLTLTDSTGATEDVDYEWDDARLNATVMPTDGAWTPGETHTLTVGFCGNTPSINFSTSEYGMDIENDSSDLIGKTYFIDLSTANYTEPPGVGSMLGLFLDMPLLLGVASLDSDVINFEAGLGEQHPTTGQWSTIGDHWIFDGADFSGSPYFSAATPLLDIPYGAVTIPVHDFAISGTFASDLGAIGFASFTGLGDTSTMGPLLNLGSDPFALCEFLNDQGIECDNCPEPNIDSDDDGVPDEIAQTCIRLTGEIDTADLLIGVDIIE